MLFQEVQLTFLKNELKLKVNLVAISAQTFLSHPHNRLGMPIKQNLKVNSTILSFPNKGIIL